MASHDHTVSGDVKSVRVIPIARGILKDHLTYFTTKDIAPGAIVSVPVRGKSVDAVVLSCKQVASAKTTIKSSSFRMKKVGGVKHRAFFSPAFIEAAEETAEYVAGTIGATLHALTPKGIFEYETPKETDHTKRQRHSEGTNREVLLAQAGDSERVSTYKSVIREEFARKASVFFCMPEVSEIEHMKETLEKGIEDYTYVLHGGLTRKQLAEIWKRILKEEHPVLIIGTGTFLSLPRHDIGTIILEKESSRAYKTQARPFIDFRTFATIFSRHAGIRLVMGDIFLRPETLHKKDAGLYAELSPLKFRALSTATQQIVDIKTESDTLKERSRLEIVSPAFRDLLASLKEENTNMFVLAARRGLFPLTICADCGKTALCKQCGNPIVLHKKGAGAKNTALCHKCGLEQKAEDRCSVCGSWRLTTLGIGIQFVEDEIRAAVPDAHIFRIDKDTTSTHKKALEVRDRFYANPGNILIGTEMAVSYLDREVDNVVISSVDSLFTIPDFRVSERVFGTLLRLRAKATKHFLVQTRDVKNTIFEHITKGNLIDFYREEIEDREALKYPPFSVLIKVSRTGTEKKVVDDMAKVKDLLADFSPDFLPAFSQGGTRGSYGLNAIIKIPAKEWPDKKLLTLLGNLPPACAVNVNPESVL